MTSIRFSRRLRALCAVALLAWASGCAASGSLEAKAAADVGPPPVAARQPMDAAGAVEVDAAAAAAPGQAPRAAMPASSPKASTASASSAGAKEPSSGDEKLHADHLLIFDGQMQMEVPQKRFAESIDALVDIAADAGGYVAEQNNSSVSVRVPSKRFREVMRAMEKVGEVIHRQVQAQDVTEEYNDLKVRLKSLRATRDRIEDFLKRAKNIQEVLQVEQQLSRLNGEIDRIEGRMRFLSQRASFSTITVSLSAKPEKKVVVKRDDTPPPPPKPKTLSLPIGWLKSVGVDSLLDL